MEYVFLSVGLIVLVVLILAFRPTHRESAMRGAMNAQRVLDAQQARAHKEFRHIDTPPQRVQHLTRAELIGEFVPKRKKRKAEAWAQSILNDGGAVWIAGDGTIWFRDGHGVVGNQSFAGDWD